MYKVLREKENAKLVQSVAYDAQTLYEQVDENESSGRNGDETAVSTIGEEEFAFDTTLINSKAYRRVPAAKTAELVARYNKKRGTTQNGSDFNNYMRRTEEAHLNIDGVDPEFQPFANTGPDHSLAMSLMTQWLDVCDEESIEDKIRAMFSNWKGDLLGSVVRENLENWILNANSDCMNPIPENLLRNSVQPREGRLSSRVEFDTFFELCQSLRNIAIQHKEANIETNLTFSENHVGLETSLAIKCSSKVVPCLGFFTRQRQSLAYCVSPFQNVESMKHILPDLGWYSDQQNSPDEIRISDLDTFSGIAYSLAKIWTPRIEEVLTIWEKQLSMLPDDTSYLYTWPLRKLRDVAIDISDDIRSSNDFSRTSELDLILAAARYLPPSALQNFRECPVAPLTELQQKCQSIFRKIGGCIFDLQDSNATLALRGNRASYIRNYTHNRQPCPQTLPDISTWQNLRISERTNKLLLQIQDWDTTRSTIKSCRNWANGNPTLETKIISGFQRHREFLHDIIQWRLSNCSNLTVRLRIISAKNLWSKNHG
jgi:hypothetical protein